jgi:hypothetical protein
MRLLVDGLNTLPDCEPAGKDMDVEGKAQRAYRAAARVSLDGARAWLLNPAGATAVGGVPTWAVRGFVHETGATGTLGEFKVVDASASLAARQQFTDQIGLITAAFYQPGRSRGVGTGEGHQRRENLTESDGPPVGRLLAVVNIRYVDAVELPRN